MSDENVLKEKVKMEQTARQQAEVVFLGLPWLLYL